MHYRTFGRTGWQVSEIGYGMWGMGGWTGSDDDESLRALDRAFELGCNFFDTAWVYGAGNSEQLLGEALRARTADTPLYVAHQDPAEEPEVAGQGRVPRCTTSSRPITSASPRENSLENLGVDTIDLQQFHVWSDAWADDDGLAARDRRPEAREARARRSASA